MKDISPTELKARLAAGDALILVDVREPHEHEDYDIGGTNIPVTQLPFRIEDLKQLGTGEFVLYCHSGNRSRLAQNLLAAQFQIDNTINLLGGIKAWRENFPGE